MQKSIHIVRDIHRSPHWHCSANAGKSSPSSSTVQAPQAENGSRSSSPSLSLSLSLSLPLSHMCSLPLSSNICLHSFVWLSFPPLTPTLQNIFHSLSIQSFFFLSLTPNYPFPSCQREETGGKKIEKSYSLLSPVSAACLTRTQQCYQAL